MNEVFARPAVRAIIEKEENYNKYILIQCRRKENGDNTNGLIELAGGKIREYENIFDALRREVEEETGLIITEILGEQNCQETSMDGTHTISFEPFCIVQNLSGIYSLIMHTFVCHATKGALLESTNEAENIHWEKLEIIEEMLTNTPHKIFPMDLIPLKKYIEKQH